MQTFFNLSISTPSDDAEVVKLANNCVEQSNALLNFTNDSFYFHFCTGQSIILCACSQVYFVKYSGFFERNSAHSGSLLYPSLLRTGHNWVAV